MSPTVYYIFNQYFSGRGQENRFQSVTGGVNPVILKLTVCPVSVSVLRHHSFGRNLKGRKDGWSVNPVEETKSRKSDGWSIIMVVVV